VSRHRIPPATPLEADIQAEIRLALARIPGVIAWRNKTGVARHGFGENERIVRYGLIRGGSDLIGIVTRDFLTLDLRPVTIGQFFALEVKRPGEHPTPEQDLFLSCVRRYVGFATTADSVEAAVAAIERARAGETS